MPYFLSTFVGCGRFHLEMIYKKVLYSLESEAEFTEFIDIFKNGT